MKNKKLFQKIVLIALAVAVLVALVAPAIFSQPLPAPKQEKLLNGLKVLMWPDAKADKVTVRIRIHAGSAFDPQGKEGVMQMLADNIFPNEAAREFFTEDLGGSLEVVTNYDFIQINASSKPENFVTMLETLSAAVSNPAIDKETTVKLRNALLEKIKTLEADPAYVADQAVARRLFGTFPYGRPQKGTMASVQKIDFADLIDAKSRFLSADNATITISGNFDRSLGRKATSRLFGGWLKADKKVPATFRQPDEPDTKQLQIEIPDLKKSYARSAKNAPARNDRDYYSTLIFARIGQEQRCPDTGKYQANLLRGIYVSQNDRNWGDLPVPCPFLLQKNDGRLIYPEVRHDDFEAAKGRVVAAIQNQVATPTGLADLWLDVDTYKLVSPDDEVRKAMAVTLADVRAVAEKLSASPTVRVSVNLPLKSG